MLKRVCLFGLALTACMTAPAQPKSITFDQATRVFRLDGGNMSYAFGVNARGELQQIYWGGRVAPTDAFSQPAPMREWASFDDSYTNTPQEYAGGDRGCMSSPLSRSPSPTAFATWSCAMTVIRLAPTLSRLFSKTSSDLSSSSCITPSMLTPGFLRARRRLKIAARTR